MIVEVKVLKASEFFTLKAKSLIADPLLIKKEVKESTAFVNVFTTFSYFSDLRIASTVFVMNFPKEPDNSNKFFPVTLNNRLRGDTIWIKDLKTDVPSLAIENKPEKASFNVSRYCNPSSFVTITEVALTAWPKVTFNAFLISSNPFNATCAFVSIAARINLFLVILLSSAIQSVKTL